MWGVINSFQIPTQACDQLETKNKESLTTPPGLIYIYISTLKKKKKYIYIYYLCCKNT